MCKALLIIDIQNDYYENGAMALVGADTAAAKARIILDKFRAEQNTIVHIQHIFTRPGAAFFLPDTFGAEIHSMVKPLPNEKVIVKHSANGFKDTELLDYLKSNNISELVFCGMMTHMCIDATVRAAKDYGFDCTVIGDACATKNLELDGIVINASDVHYSFLAALKTTYAKIVSADYYLLKSLDKYSVIPFEV